MKTILLIIGIALLGVSCRKKGCTDWSAVNTSYEAKKDDGSCKYPNRAIFGNFETNVVGDNNGEYTIAATFEQHGQLLYQSDSIHTNTQWGKWAFEVSDVIYFDSFEEADSITVTIVGTPTPISCKIYPEKYHSVMTENAGMQETYSYTWRGVNLGSNTYNMPWTNNDTPVDIIISEWVD